MKQFAFLITLLSFASIINSQNLNYDWTISQGSSNFDMGRSIVADNLGNIYVTGEYGQTVDFDPGIAIDNRTAVGSTDIFISKYDSFGQLIWVKSIGGANAEHVHSIAVRDSNLYITGSFQGTADFDPSSGVNSLTSNGGDDIFVCKLNILGDFVWAVKMGGTSNDAGRAVGIDNLGNTYITGYFRGTVDFNPGSGTSNITSAGNSDIFLVKLDSNGSHVWSNHTGGTADDFGKGLAIDSNENVIVTGYFSGTVDLDPGTGVVNGSGASENIFIQKFASNGNLVWAKSVSGSNAERGNAVTTDARGNIYTTGTFDSSVDFDPGAGVSMLTPANRFDIFIQKLDSNGNFILAKKMGGNFHDEAIDIQVDSNESIYTTGQYEGLADFDPSAAIFNKLAPGPSGIFISKLDSNGVFEWVASMGGNAGTIFPNKGFSLVIDNQSNIYTTGVYEGTSDFDPTISVQNFTSMGGADIFIQKLSQSIATGIQGQSTKNIQSIKVYPNPSNGILMVVNKESSIYNIRVLDNLGRIIEEFKSVNQQIRVDLSNYQNGLYFIQVGSHVEKLLLSK